MGILSWVIFGLIAGILAKWIMPGRDGGGFIMTILLGIVGAVVGGRLRLRGSAARGAVVLEVSVEVARAVATARIAVVTNIITVRGRVTVVDASTIAEKTIPATEDETTTGVEVVVEPTTTRLVAAAATAH